MGWFTAPVSAGCNPTETGGMSRAQVGGAGQSAPTSRTRPSFLVDDGIQDRAWPGVPWNTPMATPRLTHGRRSSTARRSYSVGPAIKCVALRSAENPWRAARCHALADPGAASSRARARTVDSDRPGPLAVGGCSWCYWLPKFDPARMHPRAILAQDRRCSNRR